MAEYIADLHKDIKKTKKYLTAAKFDGYKALGDTLKDVVDYDVSKLHTKEKEFKEKLSKKIEAIAKDQGIELKGISDAQKDRVWNDLLGISYTSLVERVSDLGEGLTTQDLINQLDRDRQRFEAEHYKGIAQHHIDSQDKIRPGLEYLSKIGEFNIEDLRDIDNMQPHHAHAAFYGWGAMGAGKIDVRALPQYGMDSAFVSPGKKSASELEKMVKKSEEEKEEKKKAA